MVWHNRYRAFTLHLLYSNLLYCQGTQFAEFVCLVFPGAEEKVLQEGNEGNEEAS